MWTCKNRGTMKHTQMPFATSRPHELFFLKPTFPEDSTQWSSPQKLPAVQRQSPKVDVEARARARAKEKGKSRGKSKGMGSRRGRGRGKGTSAPPPPRPTHKRPPRRTASSVSKPMDTDIICFQCGQKGHSSEDCMNPPSLKRTRQESSMVVIDEPPWMHIERLERVAEELANEEVTS